MQPLLQAVGSRQAKSLKTCAEVPTSKGNPSLTLVEQGEALGLVGAVRVEVENDEVARDVHHLPWRAAPVEARHHLVCVSVQQLHHVALVRDVEEGEVEEDGG